MFVGYAFTRMLSTPLDNQDVGNWACTLGLAALFVEGLMVAVAAYAISLRRMASLEPLGDQQPDQSKSHDVLSTGSPKEADSLGFEGSSLSPFGIAVLRGARRSVGC